MSRTFRRKHIYSREYVKTNLVYFNYFLDYHYIRTDVDLSEKEIDKSYHRWHGDKDLGYTPPKSYIKTLNRSFRAKSKATLKQALQNCNEDEVIFDPCIKNAAWYYW